MTARFVVVMTVLAIVAGCSTVYVLTGKDNKVEDKDTIGRRVDIDRERKEKTTP